MARHPLRSLDARFVIALSSVALICLLVSGLALNQILPGYFAEQAQRRLESARASTELVMVNTLNRTRLEALQVPELRERILQQLARDAADNLAVARVEIIQMTDGAHVAHALPSDTELLHEQGLRPDRQVPSVGFVVQLDIGIPQPPATLERDTVVQLWVQISEPYTSREMSLEQVRGALVAARRASSTSGCRPPAWPRSTSWGSSSTRWPSG
jgi:hypothetical protein